MPNVPRTDWPALVEPHVEVDVDGLKDRTKDIEYVGKALKQTNGKYRCLAKIPWSEATALCVVEVTVTELPEVA